MSKAERAEVMISALEYSVLSAGGELKNVKRAMASKDLASMVRAGLRALKKTDMPGILSRAGQHKSVDKSNQFRREGNKYFQKRDYREATLCYNKALAYAPNNSLEIKLAYSNLSAAYFARKIYKECLLNIEAALALDCPESLRVKLEKRSIEAGNYVLQETIVEVLLQNKDIANYMSFDVKRNAEIPCASTDVSVVDGVVVAANDIKSGTMVALEEAYVSTQDKSLKYLSCFYCHRRGFFFIPCKGCTKALFCSKECSDKCLEEYHRVECHINDYLYLDSSDINQELNKLAVKAAIKMSLKLGWKELRVASLDMGKARFEKSSVAEAFDCNNPTSILCYDDQTENPENIVVNKGLFCAMVLHLISRVPDYFPKEKKEKQEAMDALSRIILHLNTTFRRKIKILCSEAEPQEEEKTFYDSDAYNSVGWFSLTSKLAHSCEPNLLALGFHDHVALIALQRIKKGEQLTISYIDHFYDMRLVPSPKNTRIRQQIIEKEIFYLCKCRVCLLEWDCTSHQQGTLTHRQQVAYRVSSASKGSADFKQRMKVIGSALDELTGCINTAQHREVYIALMKLLGTVRFLTLLFG